MPFMLHIYELVAILLNILQNMNRQILILFFSLSTLTLFGQTSSKIYTSDIANFWIAYDKIQSTTDTIQRINFIQNLYIDKASTGLKGFIKARNFTASEWVKSFETYPKFWISIRPKTMSIIDNKEQIDKIFKKFRRLYSSFHQPEIYFTIGCFKGGGTVINGNLIIGSELAASDKTIDASELSQSNQDRMKMNTGVIFLTIHESVHTQQKLKNENYSLLGNSLKEGSADFIAELLINKTVEAPYIEYGNKNEKNLWQKFKTEMYQENLDDWLYNIRFIKDKPADLGYFIGYTICKTYYNNSKNKKQAIKEIIELDYNNIKKCEEFLKKSKYPEKWN